eukprot:395147_1
MAVRGSASIDTGRFANKDKEFENKIKWPKSLNTRVNMKKVVFNSIKPWIEKEIETLLGFDDDVVVNLIYNLLENTQYPDAKQISVKLMGFLEQDTIPFMLKLWSHLIDANNNKLGISTKLLADAKQKAQIKKEQILQNDPKFKLKKEIEQNQLKPSYNNYNTYNKRPHNNYNNYRNNNNNRYNNHNRNSNNYKPQYGQYNNDIERIERAPKERDSMNSCWPPSPSPPAILSVRNVSPSPPMELKSRKKSLKKKKKKKRRSRSRSLSYSRSRSRDRDRHRDKSRSRSGTQSRSRSGSRSRSRSRSRS